MGYQSPTTYVAECLVLRTLLSSIAIAAALCLAPQIADAANKAKPAPTATPAKDPGAACPGTDILATLPEANPALHAAVMEKAATVENSTAILWKIEKDGRAASHIFGTLHLTDDRLTKLSEPVRAALQSSARVVLELAGTPPDTMAHALATAAKSAIYENGDSLEKHLTPDEFKKVRTTLDRAGMPSSAAASYKPWLISFLTTVTACERERIRKGVPSLDLKIESEAKARGVEIVALETVEQQINGLASMPEDQQLALLRAGIALGDRMEDSMETLIAAYLARRVPAFWALQTALAGQSGIPADTFETFEASMIAARNQKMLDGAVAELDKGGAFIAVGVMHLYGKTGLVQLFRDKGFTVTPIE